MMHHPLRNLLAWTTSFFVAMSGVIVLLGPPASTAARALPDQTAKVDAAARKLGKFVYPVKGRWFKATKRDVFDDPGRFGKVLEGKLPQGLNVKKGVLKGKTKKTGLFTAQLLVKDRDKWRKRRVSLRVSKPRAARNGTRLLTPSSSSDAHGPTASGGVDVSADGGVVTFVSDHDTLVDSDENGASDVFAWSRSADEITLVSHAADGDSADSEAFLATISADGRYVAFVSAASDLTSATGRGGYEIYVRDLVTDELVQVTAGVERSPSFWLGPTVLDDGSVAFGVREFGYRDRAYRWDRATATVTMPVATPTQFAGEAMYAGTSGDGQWQLWKDSSVGELVAIDTKTGAEKGRCATEMRFTTGSATFSADGTRVVVEGRADLERDPVRTQSRPGYCDLSTGKGTTSVGEGVGLTADGRTVVQTSYVGRPTLNKFFALRVGGFPTAERSVFRRTASTTKGDMAISADGGTVVYSSDANNVLDADTDRHLDVFVWDRTGR